MWCLVCHRQFASDVEGVLELLPHREGEVLALRYGLFTGEPQSLTDVAKVLKMSVEGVRKNELSAFRCALAVSVTRKSNHVFCKGEECNSLSVLWQ